ncbi:MAG: methylmalonyl-CoA epimerase [Oligoflexia bacterium]|nr:methylmalonyl-CoA epimerase [Oligoflexia bacterium]
MVKKIDHIGIAVNSIDEQLPYYQYVLGLEIEKIEEVPEQGVKVCFLKVGEVHIELLEPLNDQSPVQKFLDSKGQGVHHIAYEAEDLEQVIDRMNRNLVDLINKAPKKGADGKKICFAHPRSTFGVLTEICQKAEADNE